MDNLWTVFVIAILLATIILHRSWKRNTSRYRRPSLPLGTLGWPFVGETIEFISCAYSDRPESFMDKRRRMYGKVFKSHIFGSPTIVSTDSEISRFVLQSDAKVFVPSYPKSLTELMGKSSILLINGSLQRRVHGLIGAFFKSPYLRAQITKDMQSYVEASMQRWNDDHLIYIQDETKNIAFQVLVKALISLDSGEEMEFLKLQFQEFIAGLMSLPVNVPGSTLYRSLQAKKNMVKLIEKIIKERRKNSISSSFPKDVADVLLNHTSSEQLTDNLISDNIIDLMIPGEDSVPVLMTLAIKYLSDSPVALRQLTEENMKLKTLKAQLGEELAWNDYMSLQFTQNVITETLRMGNIIVGVMRKAMKDVEIKGYLIPKGWCVFTYFRSVHLDDHHYDWPYQFNPWRWQDKDMGTYNFTPFGGGQRLCPGLDLARLEASIFLHHFVTQFRWVAEDDSIVNFPTVKMRRRMPVWVKRRRDPQSFFGPRESNSVINDTVRINGDGKESSVHTCGDHPHLTHLLFSSSSPLHISLIDTFFLLLLLLSSSHFIDREIWLYRYILWDLHSILDFKFQLILLPHFSSFCKCNEVCMRARGPPSHV